MNNRNFKYLLLLFLPLMIAACSKKEVNPHRVAARQLFEKSQSLGEGYIKQMRQVKDSAALFRLMDRYDHQLTALNYRYPANTDQYISEGENDTLITINHRMVSLRDSLLKLYAFRKLHPDTITRDTVANPNF